jgi:hypothetical protein
MANLQFHTSVFAEPFTCTWEEVATALETLPRMIFEPDGSWIWSGGVGRDRWQVDGHLFDFAGRLHRVELHGECPPEAFDQLLRCIGWPDTTLLFEQVREGVRLDEAEFRRRTASRVVPDPGD